MSAQCLQNDQLTNRRKENEAPSGLGDLKLLGEMEGELSSDSEN